MEDSITIRIAKCVLCLIEAICNNSSDHFGSSSSSQSNGLLSEASYTLVALTKQRKLIKKKLCLTEWVTAYRDEESEVDFDGRFKQSLVAVVHKFTTDIVSRASIRRPFNSVDNIPFIIRNIYGVLEDLTNSDLNGMNSLSTILSPQSNIYMLNTPVIDGIHIMLTPGLDEREKCRDTVVKFKTSHLKHWIIEAMAIAFMNLPRIMSTTILAISDLIQTKMELEDLLFICYVMTNLNLSCFISDNQVMGDDIVDPRSDEMKFLTNAIIIEAYPLMAKCDKIPDLKLTSPMVMHEALISCYHHSEVISIRNDVTGLLVYNDATPPYVDLKESICEPLTMDEWLSCLCNWSCHGKDINIDNTNGNLGAVIVGCHSTCSGVRYPQTLLPLIATQLAKTQYTLTTTVSSISPFRRALDNTIGGTIMHFEEEDNSSLTIQKLGLLTTTDTTLVNWIDLSLLRDDGHMLDNIQQNITCSWLNQSPTLACGLYRMFRMKLDPIELNNIAECMMNV